MQNHQYSAPFITAQDFLQIVARASQSYNDTSSFADFIAFLRDTIFCHLGQVSVEIYFRDENRNVFISHPFVAPDIPSNHTIGVPPMIPTSDPVFADVVAHHTPVTVNSDMDSHYVLSLTGNQSHTIFPIISEDQTIALLYVGCRENTAFPDDYREGIQAITSIIGSWLRSKGVISEIESSMTSLKHSEQIRQALYEISEQAHLTTKEEELYSSLHEIVGRFINARNFLIALRKERDGEQYIQLTYYSDEIDSQLQGLEFKTDPNKPPTMTGFLIQNGEPVLIGPGEFDLFCQEKDINYLGSKAYSLIGAPFYLDHLAGVVIVQSYSDVIYTEKDKDLLAFVARHIGDALERKKIIDELRHTNEMFSLFMRYSPAYIFFKDVTEFQSRVIHASENYKNITGIPGSEMVDMSIHQLFPADFADEVIANDWKVVSSGVPLHLEQHFDNRSYTTIKFPIAQEDKTLLAEFSLDITERKQMEEALRESERRYRIIFEKSPFGVVCFNAEGTLLDYNDTFIEIMGATRKKLIGFNPLQQSTPIVKNALKKAIAGEIAFCEDFYTSVTGGKKTYLRGIFCPVTPGQGPTEVIATIEDITEQKEREKEQQQIEKLESLGVLAGGIAHDFNNILTGIMANISFAQVFIDSQHRAYIPLEEAEKASKRAAELAQQLLTFAKGGEPHKKVTSIEHLIQEAVSFMLRGTNVRADVTIPETIHAVEADGGQISQVFNNIIINGTQAMPGGGTLHIMAENQLLPRDNIYGIAPGNYIKIALKDEGCGITLKDKKRIFDPYFTTKATGTGLGLASAYSIIARHKGHIVVDSIVGEGTTFTLFLPSIGKSSPEQRITVSPKSNPVQVGTILVMDDEKMIRDIATAMFSHFGYTVTTCSRGEEAIELHKKALETQETYNAIIMDLTIPGGLGGKQAAEQILSISPQARIIVSSGYSNDPVMSNYKEFGFSGAIAKPYNMHEVEQMLGSLFE